MGGAHRADRTGRTTQPDQGREVIVETSEGMWDLGRRLSTVLRPGDVVVLSGDLGAGKTTLTQGIGAGLGVRGQITSPTFVIARVHPAEGEGPGLVHVDAYRLSGLAEVDDLDLDATLADSVTVVEWGDGLVEDLSPDRLEVHLHRPKGTDGGPDEAPLDGDQPRFVQCTGYGARWRGVPLPID